MGVGGGTREWVGEWRAVTDDVISQARKLCLGVYSGKKDDFSGSNLCSLRMYNFLNSKSVFL